MRTRARFDKDSGARKSRKAILAALAVAVFAATLGSISSGQSQPAKPQSQSQSQSQQQQSPPQSAQPTAPSSQQPAPPQSKSKISTEVKLVTVYTSVRDKHCKIIPDWPQADFALQEDARPKTIKYFARESYLPLTLGLLVDTSLSQRRVLDQEQSAS